MNTVLYLRDKSLQLYSDKLKGKGFVLNFPPQVINNLEIKDSDKFKDLVVSWITQSEIGKQKVVIVLSEEIFFTKSIPLDSRDLASQIEGFVSEIPFEPEMVAKTYFQTDQEYILVAANKQLHETIKHIVEELGWELVGVVPSLVYGDIGKGERLNEEEVELVLKREDLLRDFNLLTPNDLNDLMSLQSAEIAAQSKLEEPNKMGAEKKSGGWLVFLMLVVILGGGVFLALNMGILKLPFSKQASTITPVIQPSPSPINQLLTPTPEISINKKELKVQVINGTGIPGQAAEVRGLMEGVGFVGVETDNASEKVTEAEVNFATKVPQSIQDEVLAELDKTFTKVRSKNGIDNTLYDITITTGQYRQNQ